MQRFKARRLLPIFAIALATVVLFSGVAIGSDEFSDVPNDHQFHSDIGWLKDSGITSGCTATTFCPQSAVTRGQMAAFLHRTADVAVVDSGSSVQTFSAATFTDLTGSSNTVTVPPGGTRVLIMTFSAESVCSDADGDDIGYVPVRIMVGSTEANPAVGVDYAFDSCKTETSGNPDKWEGHSMTRTLSVAPGEYTVKVQAYVTDAVDGDTADLDDWNLSILVTRAV